MKIASLIGFTAVLLLSGCAYKTSAYGVSVPNVEAIKRLDIRPVAVATFESSKPGLTSITCRAAGPVTVSPSFETYIEKAFIDELTLAGVYDPTSPLRISGKLDEVDFSSGMVDGNWLFTLTLSNARNQSLSVKSVHAFSGSFSADKACQEVAQALAPAVQQLIKDVVRNPNFKRVANGS